MTEPRPFTARLDDQALHVTYDDGTNRIFRGDIVEQIKRLLTDAPSEPARFTAMTAASFAEAEHASPDPARGEGLVGLAQPSETTTDPRNRIPLGGRPSPPSRPLTDVLNDRQSQRDLRPPTLDDLAAVLVRSARVIDWNYDDRRIETSFRPSPSAGALHPIRIHLIADQVSDLDPGCWEFDPFRCDLMPSTVPPEAVTRARHLITQAANVDTVPAALVLVADPARTLQRYPHGTAHLWRDAGALLATLHLAATDLGLGSVILGTSGVLHRFDPSGPGTVDIGSIVIGRAAPA